MATIRQAECMVYFGEDGPTGVRYYAELVGRSESGNYNLAVWYPETNEWKSIEDVPEHHVM